ncbi:MAG: superoxide dismutase [Fe] [Alphaproteobacteria bacterium]|nr:superoxide dismutase [Fe] [Alphaproteobacteria bacterium]
MTISMPTLPYNAAALAPVLMPASVERHFTDHHCRYVARLNELVASGPLADATLDEILRRAAPRGARSELFNCAAESWNHAFYWRSMKAGGGGLPIDAMRAQINSDFKNYKNFAARWKKAAAAQFGGGWLWLVYDVGRLKIVTTKDAYTPILRGLQPIIGMDLWEHAYYPDYGAKRDEYADRFLNSLLNWEFANENLVKAKVSGMIDRTVGPMHAPAEAAVAGK